MSSTWRRSRPPKAGFIRTGRTSLSSSRMRCRSCWAAAICCSRAWACCCRDAVSATASLCEAPARGGDGADCYAGGAIGWWARCRGAGHDLLAVWTALRGNRIGVIGEMDPAGVICPAIHLGKTCRHWQAQYAQEQTPKFYHGLITISLIVIAGVRAVVVHAGGGPQRYGRVTGSDRVAGPWLIVHDVRTGLLNDTWPIDSRHVHCEGLR